MKCMLITVIAISVVAGVLARPEPPKPRYGPPPPSPHKEYGPPPAPPAPQKEYGPPPPAPQREYAAPGEIYVSHEEAPQQSLPLYAPANFYAAPSNGYPAPSNSYGPPANTYGPPPTVETLVTKNVYVHVPPQEPEVFNLPEPIQAAVPKKHYKIIFIKAPNPPQPIRQVVPPAAQDEHKTLVYVLVKKPEEQQPLVLPSPAPTEPSKPEVYFIKYKQHNKPSEQYGPPSPPAQTYGVPSQSERF